LRKPEIPGSEDNIARHVGRANEAAAQSYQGSGLSIMYRRVLERDSFSTSWPATKGGQGFSRSDGCCHGIRKYTTKASSSAFLISCMRLKVTRIPVKACLAQYDLSMAQHSLVSLARFPFSIIRLEHRPVLRATVRYKASVTQFNPDRRNALSFATKVPSRSFSLVISSSALLEGR